MSSILWSWKGRRSIARRCRRIHWLRPPGGSGRSEEHTSELQSLRHLVCRLLLEKKKKLIIVQFWTSFLVRIYAWTTILQDGGLVGRAGRSLGVLAGPLTVL